MNKKASWKQDLMQKFHERNKHLGNIACKTFGPILEIDKEGTQTNGLKEKKIDYYAQGRTTLERWNRQIRRGRRKRIHKHLEIHTFINTVTLKWSKKD